MTRNDNDPLKDIDQLFAEARHDRLDAPVDLAARVLADARQAQAVPAVPRRRPRRFSAWVENFGGWPALGGLAAASCVGFWIGVSPPAVLPDPASVLFELPGAVYEEADALSGFGWDIAEG